MRFYRRAERRPSALGVLPGTFNPVTIAHLALGKAALSHVDEVLFALPREFPHKPYTGASFEERLKMLLASAGDSREFSVAAVQGGLFSDIAAECRAAYGEDTSLTFLCGRDAAERIVNWDYGTPGAIGAILRQFSLLVAARGGEYSPPPELRNAIRGLELSGEFDRVSSSELRDRIVRGLPWEHLAPPGIQEDVKRIYGTKPE
jgi:cytidyltransferase-like protein